MEGTLPSANVSVAGKQRRRSVGKIRRKFPAKDIQKKIVLPPPATIPKKARNLVLFRVFAIGTLFFVLLSTFALWRKRQLHRTELTDNLYSPNKVGSSLPPPHAESVPDKTASVITNEAPQIDPQEQQRRVYQSKDGSQRDSSESVHKEKSNQLVTKGLDQLPGNSNSSAEEKENGMVANNQNDQPAVRSPYSGDVNSSAMGKKEGYSAIDSANTDVNQKHPDYQEPPEQIEWYTRNDFKEGKRPICRISKPIILSNSTILLPDWMQANDELLHKCGLRGYGFYSSSETSGVQSFIDIDADFGLTIHLDKFQEPTHVPAVFLTEHVLKSSFLFDTFTGVTRPMEEVAETHCSATKSVTNCGLSPQHNILKPGIFVPKRVENWASMFVQMLGVAHGDGHGVVHLNASSILIKSHAEQSDALLGTRFRSILTADGMFRHLPADALDRSSFFSAKNGITRTQPGRRKEGNCHVNIGISASHDMLSGFPSSSELKQKLEMLSKFAPVSELEVKEMETSPADLQEHIKHMQDLDVFVAGSGDDMTSIGFLSSGSAVFELIPFGISPDTHRNLAQALKLDYHAIQGKPQDESFKQCIQDEIFNLRKKGKLQFTEAPEWQEPLMKAWEKAVGEFIMSGASKFDVLTSEEPVKNYFSRHCALKQKIEIGIDDAARQIIGTSKQMCTSK